MPRKPRTGQCVYCGTEGFVTSDHVPPKCLFPPSARVNLVTVHACAQCHDSYKLDDEYFRVILSLRADLPERSETEFLRVQTKKTLQNPSARGLRTRLQAATIGIESGGPEKMAAVRIEPARIVSTAERIVRGLYATYLNKTLPNTHGVSVNLLDFQKNDRAVQSPQVQEVLGLLEHFGGHRQFGNVLDLRFLKTDDDTSSSLWWVQLHDVFAFLGYTVPRDG